MARKVKTNLPDKLTDDIVLNPDFFRNDIEELYQQVDEITEFTDKVKSDLDKNYFSPERREMMHRGSMTLAAEELKAVTSLLSAKGSITNQIITAKSKIAQLSQNKQKDAIDTKNTENLAREFQKFFLDHRNELPPIPESNTVIDQDKALQERISQMENQGQLQFTDAERALKYENRDIGIYIKEYPSLHFVAVAQDTMEVLSDYPSSLLPNPEILNKIKKINGTTYDFNGMAFTIL
jgi:hypothetical protein